MLMHIHIDKELKDMNFAEILNEIYSLDFVNAIELYEDKSAAVITRDFLNNEIVAGMIGTSTLDFSYNSNIDSDKKAYFMSLLIYASQIPVDKRNVTRKYTYLLPYEVWSYAADYDEYRLSIIEDEYLFTRVGSENGKYYFEEMDDDLPVFAQYLNKTPFFIMEEE